MLMITYSEILQTVLEAFKSAEDLKEVKFLYDFPAKKQDLPLRSPIVTVGFEEIKVETTEIKEIIFFDASPCTATLRLLLCIPKEQSGFRCYELLEKVINNCKLLLGQYDVTNIKSGQMRFDSSVCGLILPLYITLELGNAFVTNG